MKTTDNYFETDEFKSILEEYESAINLGLPVNLDVEDLSDLAQYYYENHKQLECIVALQKALSMNPGAAAPNSFIVNFLIDQGLAFMAEVYEKKITETDSLDYYLVHATILTAQGKAQEASDYLKGLDIDPEDYDDFIIDVSSMFYSQNAYQESRAWALKYSDQQDEVIRKILADNAFQLGEFDKSIAILKDLLDKDAFSNEYWTCLSVSQYMLEKYDEALESAEYALAIDPKDVEALLSKANCLYEYEKFDEALEYYRRLSAVEPNSYFSIYRQASILNLLGRNQECIIFLKDLLTNIERLNSMYDDMEENPYTRILILRRELSDAYTRLGKFQKAYNVLDECHGEDNNSETESQIYILQGQILLKAKKIDKSEMAFEKALKLSSDKLMARMSVATILYENGFYEKSLHLLKFIFANKNRGKHKGKEWIDGYSYAASCCLKLNDQKGFMRYMKTAVEINPLEAKDILGFIFPENLATSEYCNYYLTNIANKK